MEQAPTTSEVIDWLIMSGDMFTEDTHRLKYHLDYIAPVIGKFTVENLPLRGAAPDEIKAAWVGLTLPVRAAYPDGGIPIVGTEAIYELEKAEEAVAAQWWRDYYGAEARSDFGMVNFDDHPEVLGNVSFLVFDESCGQVRAAEKEE